MNPVLSGGAILPPTALIASVAELPTENGVYLLGQGAALQPGTPLTFTLFLGIAVFVLWTVNAAISFAW